MAVIRYRFVWLAVIAAVALMFGAGSLGPRTALAAGVNIDPTSCGGAGYPNCSHLPFDVTIGANSCTVASACDSLVDGVVIGANSCNGRDACDEASGSIGENSCNPEGACYRSGLNGRSNVGDNSCNGAAACRQSGELGTNTVGDNSCNGEGACGYNGFQGGNGATGDNSCNADYACFDNGASGVGTVGDSSCNGSKACYFNGNDGNGSVGDYSCNYADACYQNGAAPESDCSLGSPGVVSECGLVDSGVFIGNLSCNQSGAYNANCQGVHEDVGNCMYNDTTPVLCTQGTIQVEKVVVGNSSDRFNLKIDGSVEAYHVGDGGTTDPVAVDPGTHSAGESAVYPARLSDYDQRTTCEAYNAIVGSHSHTIAPRTRGTALFNVNAGDVVTCTITNTKVTGFFPFRR